AADPKFVRLELDTGHYQQAGGDPAEAIRQHRDRLLFLHIKDLDSSNRFVELGRGRVNFKAVFAALDAIGFDGWGVVELVIVPDANEPSVGAFIEKMLPDWHTPAERERFLTGLEDLDTRCGARAAHAFVDCSETHQIAALTALDDEVFAAGTNEHWFARLKYL